MLNKLLNIFRIAELRTKLLFTIGLLCVYRIGFYVPLPGVNAHGMREKFMEAAKSSGASPSAFEQLSSYLSVVSGGDLTQGSIFGLGIMPYISASIIIQLLGTVVPSIEKLKKEGEPGIRKINEWTRYITVVVCFIQAYFYVQHFGAPSGRQNLFGAAADQYFWLFSMMAVLVLTAGSVFLMWLGEQIDHYGIGNGVSMIITAGIVSRMPLAVIEISKKFKLGFGGGTETIGLGPVIFIIACFVFVVAGSIFLTQAQRRIPIQQAKHMRGRRVYGGAKQYLPLKVNHAGVMPIIFASSLMMIPAVGFSYLLESRLSGASDSTLHAVLSWFANAFHIGTYLYEVLFCAMIFFFSYFWNTVQFQPKEMANQLRDYGSFIPGLRPGKRTADYLENVMTRITYVGAAFLCVIAIIPSVVGASVLSNLGNQSFMISQFLGGTSLLIVISVILDLVNRIEANLVMRNYGGLTDDSGGGNNKIKRPRGSRGGSFNAGDAKGMPA